MKIGIKPVLGGIGDCTHKESAFIVLFCDNNSIFEFEY